MGKEIVKEECYLTDTRFLVRALCKGTWAFGTGEGKYLRSEKWP